MCKDEVLGAIRIQGVVMIMLMISGCSTMIDKDTKLSLKGPKAEVSRTF